MSSKIDDAEIRRRLDLIRKIEPSPSATDRTLARIRASLESEDSHVDRRQPSSLLWTILMPRSVMKMATASVVAFGIAAILVFLAFGLQSDHVVFADVIEKFQNNPYTFEFVIRRPDQGDEMVSQVGVLKPGRIRFDSDKLGISSIADFDQALALILFHANKTAMLIDSADHGAESDAIGFAFLANPIESLWNLQDGSETTLPERNIEDQMTQGFKIRRNDESMEEEIIIWADSKTSTPVMVEAIIKSLKQEEPPQRFILRNFKIGIPLDELRFRMEPPEGYTLAYEKTFAEVQNEQANQRKVLPKDAALDRGKRIDELLKLWSRDKQEASRLFLRIEWNEDIQFPNTAIFFTMSEKGFISLSKADQDKTMKHILAKGKMGASTCETCHGGWEGAPGQSPIRWRRASLRSGESFRRRDSARSATGNDHPNDRHIDKGSGTERVDRFASRDERRCQTA